MNGPFKVGDVCIVVRSRNPEFPNGTEVTILAIDPDTCWGPVHCYVVREYPCLVMAADHNLKKKPPPSTDFERCEDEFLADLHTWLHKVKV